MHCWLTIRSVYRSVGRTVQNYARNRKIRNYSTALPRKDIYYIYIYIEKNHAHSTIRLARFARQLYNMKTLKCRTLGAGK